MSNKLDFEWRSDAACKNEDPEIFYPDMHSSHGQKIAKFAIKICGDCPVRLKCAEHGIRHERYGVWGGMTEGERTRYRSEHKIMLKTEMYNSRNFLQQDRK
jgi:WhiB family redox-sensing transcriptional regulator